MTRGGGERVRHSADLDGVGHLAAVGAGEFVGYRDRQDLGRGPVQCRQRTRARLDIVAEGVARDRLDVVDAVKRACERRRGGRAGFNVGHADDRPGNEPGREAAYRNGDQEAALWGPIGRAGGGGGDAGDDGRLGGRGLAADGDVDDAARRGVAGGDPQALAVRRDDCANVVVLGWQLGGCVERAVRVEDADQRVLVAAGAAANRLVVAGDAGGVPVGGGGDEPFREGRAAFREGGAVGSRHAGHGTDGAGGQGRALRVGVGDGCRGRGLDREGAVVLERSDPSHDDTLALVEGKVARRTVIQRQGDDAIAGAGPGCGSEDDGRRTAGERLGVAGVEGAACIVLQPA